MIYANTKQDAAAINFDDQFIYEELEKPGGEKAIVFIHYPHQKALEVFREWQNLDNKIEY